MNSKKVIKLVLVCMVLMGILVGCSSSSTNSSTSTAENNSKSEEKNTNTSSNKDKTNGKSLVVYYSASGNTEKVANIIAEIKNADVFKIEPTEVYSDDDLKWSDDNSRVSKEHNDDNRKVELKSTKADNWESYDTVYIGYPIWWGIAAWPVDGFIKGNNFEGKTVVPFCTSTSSGLGQSADLLKEMAGSGNWLEGKRFNEGPSKEEIKEWLDSLE